MHYLVSVYKELKTALKYFSLESLEKVTTKQMEYQSLKKEDYFYSLIDNVIIDPFDISVMVAIRYIRELISFKKHSDRMINRPQEANELIDMDRTILPLQKNVHAELVLYDYFVEVLKPAIKITVYIPKLRCNLCYVAYLQLLELEYRIKIQGRHGNYPTDEIVRFSQNMYAYADSILSKLKGIQGYYGTPVAQTVGISDESS